MTRIHNALNRATDGKAPILPPGVETNTGEGSESSQPGFAVPWAVSGGTGATPGGGPDATDGATVSERGTRLTSLATPAIEPTLPGVEEKLVGSAASEGKAGFSVAVEQYRKLAAALHHAQADRGLKAIVVTSANPGEGKSLTASNLALTLSESYQRRVLLVDGDLRRPALHEIFGVPNRHGLSDGLTRSSVQDIAVREVSPRLSILPSGPPIEDPTGSLTSDQMKQVLEEARASYDWVIFDTPPVGLVSDAKLLSEIVDGVVLVVEAGKSGYPDLLKAIETVGRDRVLGVVLNRLQPEPGRAKYYTNYYYSKK